MSIHPTTYSAHLQLTGLLVTLNHMTHDAGLKIYRDPATIKLVDGDALGLVRLLLRPN